MPTYDYRCLDCRKRASLVLSFSEYGTSAVACPHCGSANLKRLINRVRVMRSEDSRLDSMADPDEWGAIDENDPRSIARAMRRMGDEMGEDPESIEKSMPEMGDDSGDGGDDDFDY